MIMTRISDSLNRKRLAFIYSLLFLLSVLVHLALFWALLRNPLPQMALSQPASIEAGSQVEVELMSAEQTVQTFQPVVDENAVRPAPKKSELLPELKPELKPEPKPQHEPKSEPKPKPKPKPKPQPEPTPELKQRPESKIREQKEPADTAKSVANSAGNSTSSSSQSHNQSGNVDRGNSSGHASLKITQAVSGMQSLGNPPPDYPAVAKRRHIEGEVTLRILVSVDGRAEQVSVVRSSGSSLLDDAALATVRKWRFIPAKRGDQALSGYALQKITFRLDSENATIY